MVNKRNRGRKLVRTNNKEREGERLYEAEVYKYSEKEESSRALVGYNFGRPAPFYIFALQIPKKPMPYFPIQG